MAQADIAGESHAPKSPSGERAADPESVPASSESPVQGVDTRVNFGDDHAQQGELLGDTPDPEKVFDDGLALERTTLAWQRSVLALAVVGALIPKYGVLGLEGLLPNFFGIGIIFVALTLLGWVRWRYRKTHEALIRTGRIQGRDAKPLVGVLVLALATSSMAVGFMLFS